MNALFSSALARPVLNQDARLRQSTPRAQAFGGLGWAGIGTLVRLVWLALVLGPLSAFAQGVSLQQPLLAAGEEAYTLSAAVHFELNPRLVEALNRGVPLYFVAEFQLDRPRWYWLDQTLYRRTLTARLSYHALTRQYRLSAGERYQSFALLEDALRALQTLSGWPVLDKTALKSGETYEARLRFRLDLTQLPATFQVGAIGNRDWQLMSEWVVWPVVAGPPGGERP